MSKLNLYQKIVELRKSLPFLKKDAKGFNYKYVSGISILSVIQEKMNELGLLLIPSVLNKEYKDCSYTERVRGEEKNKFVRIVAADMVMTWIDSDSGEKLEMPWALFGEQNDISRAFGSALTYSERYFLLKALNIPTDEDDPDSVKPKKVEYKSKPLPKEEDHIVNAVLDIMGGEVVDDAPKEESTDKPMSAGQRKFIYALGKKKELSEAEIKEFVRWTAADKNLDPNSCKICKILLPEENFNKAFELFLDMKEKQVI